MVLSSNPYHQPDELVDSLSVLPPGLLVPPPLLVVVHQPLEPGVKVRPRLPQEQEPQGGDRPVRGVRLGRGVRKFQLQIGFDQLN